MRKAGPAAFRWEQPPSQVGSWEAFIGSSSRAGWKGIEEPPGSDVSPAFTSAGGPALTALENLQYHHVGF